MPHNGNLFGRWYLGKEALCFCKDHQEQERHPLLWAYSQHNINISN